MLQATRALAAGNVGSAWFARDGLPRPRIARVESFTDAAAASRAWSWLEARAGGPPYQTRRWLVPWTETVGVALGVKPQYFVAFDDAELPLALLPFGTWRHGFLNVAGFLGGKDSNFNMGLFRPGLTWTEAEVASLLERSGVSAPGRIDAFVLRNQPLTWDGRSNPLALLPRQPSPSFGYKAELAADPEAFFRASLSTDNRKKLRQKTRRLSEIGTVEHRVARTAEDVATMLAAMFEHKVARAAALGLSGSDEAALRRFLERAALPVDGSPAAIELHALVVGDAIVASFAGARHQDRFCGMLMGFAADPAVARWSPGELLLAAVIRAKCLDGCTVFDLGVGEGRYKQAYCPTPEPLFDTLVPLTAAGRAFAATEGTRLRVKRAIKQSTWAWPLFQRMRRLYRRPGSGGVTHRF